jgi:glycosyltransferase 2 family protein
MQLAGIHGHRERTTSVKKAVIYLGMLVSLVCCLLIFRHLDWLALWKALIQVKPFWLVITLLVFYGGIYARALRWALLFPSDTPVASHRLFKPVMVGYAFNNILPTGRVGEFMRAIYVGKRENTGIPVALGTIVTERLFDSLSLIIMFLAAMAFIPPMDPDLTVQFAGFHIEGKMLSTLIHQVMLGAGFLVIVMGLLMLPSIREGLVRVMGLFPFFKPFQLAMEQGLEQIMRGFGVIRNPNRLCGVITYSMLIWGINALAAMTLAWGFKDINMTMIQAMALVVIESMAVMIPAAPGYWGLYEAGMIFGFAVLELHPSKETALAYGLVMHLIFFLPTTLAGLWFASQASLKPQSYEDMHHREKNMPG